MNTLIINQSNSENLENFSEILKKDKNSIINEALELFFEEEQKKLLEKNIADENALTNLNFDEFWNDVDLDD